MRIQYCSDLHLEFPQNASHMKNNPLIPFGEILVIAGDVAYLGDKFSENPFWDQVSEDFEQVYVIPGNHEFYGGYDSGMCLKQNYREEIRENVTLLNNAVVEHPDSRLIFTSLWSLIEKEPDVIRESINDFRLIRYNNDKLSIDVFNEFYKASMDFLLPELQKKSAKKTVVVTHHLPSPQCIEEKYVGSPLTEAFCVDLTKEIEAGFADYWIYGHSHGNIPDVTIGNTLLLTNQLGYVELGESESFSRSAAIEF